MSGSALYLILIMTLASGLGAAPDLVLDLRAAVSYALRQVPAFASLKKHKEINELRLQKDELSALPKLNLIATSGLNTSIPRWPPQWNSALSLSLEQAILSNSSNNITYDIAYTKNAAAQVELIHARDLLCLKVATDFYAYGAAIQQLKIKGQKLSALLKQLDTVNRRFQQGLKTQRDVLRFKAQVQQAQIQQASARNRMEQSKDTLITTITGSNRQALVESFEFTPIEPAHVALEAIPKNEPRINNHVLFKKMQLEQKIAALDVDLSRRQLWPELSASLGATGNAYLDFKHSKSFSPSAIFMISFSLRHELLDFGTRSREVAIAIKNKDIKENALQTELSKESAAIARLMNSFSLLRESLALNKSLLSLEEDNLKKIQNDYLQGKAQYLDVISALNDLSEVKSAFYSSIFELEAQLITHRYYEGTLYDWIF